MKHTITHVPEPDHIITEPFMWKSDGGCIYLHTIDGLDIIIGPQQSKRIGIIADTAFAQSARAWERRLPAGTTVTLIQE